MAGVVRRDGLREKVIAEARKYAVKRAARSGPYVETVTLPDLARVLDAVPDVPPAEDALAAVVAAIDEAERHKHTGVSLASLRRCLTEPREGSAEFFALRAARYRTAWQSARRRAADTSDVPPDPPAVDVRTFHLQRDADVSGVSGTGLVAWGILFPDGRVATRWAQSNAGCQTSAWDSIEDVEAVHGHNGATRIVWHLVDAADVRARALEDAADALDEFKQTPPHALTDDAQLLWVIGVMAAAGHLRDRAVSEHEGTSDG